ncbi:MAG: hypothetical protein P1P88_26400, partial [Bacteroidales bacterium]|nr:hypothetical protein [Bacteroidales bacterium]
MEIHRNIKEIEAAILFFKANKSQESFNSILHLLNLPTNECNCCKKPIFYYDTDVLFYKRKNKFHVSIKGKTSKSTKKINEKTYSLVICEKCLIKKFPEYELKNKSRVFNLVQPITEYAFNIPNEISKQYKEIHYKVTKNNLVK